MDTAPASKAAPFPPDEALRLAVLRSYDLLDTPAEQEFDDLVRLAAETCGAPVALMTLVAEDRQWFKAKYGVEVDGTSRDVSFCAHALLEPHEPLVVSDTSVDSRFVDNPFVTGPMHVRFYAGVPLVGVDQQPLGTLCVLDMEPRALSDEQLDRLRVLARQVVALLELRRTLTQLTRSPGSVGSDAEIERALADAQLVVHYQPVWRLSEHDGAVLARVSGAEALVRWAHPTRGLLQPNEFLGRIAELGLVGQLGEVVLSSALHQLAQWERDSLLPEDFQLHVNIAPEHFNGGGVSALVSRLLAETGITADRLCLEVTESASIDRNAFTPSAAGGLTAGGTSLALDDFGTGFSSLAQLRDYPFDLLKIDRCFVAGLGLRAVDETIVWGTVQLALRLGMRTIAEGVETVHQLRHVLDAGCMLVQGFLLGEPVPARRAEDTWLRAPYRVVVDSAVEQRAVTLP